MRIAIMYSPWLLGQPDAEGRRRVIDMANYRTDPHGMTGSEIGFVRIAEELQKLGHEVELFSVFDNSGECTRTKSNGFTLVNWVGDIVQSRDSDVVISVNCPDELRYSAGLRVCLFWLNEMSFCKAGFEEHVDLFASCSEPHLRQVMDNPKWWRVDVTPAHPDGRVTYRADPAKWCVIPLGCDPQNYPETAKVPGRVVYCSSPDRGLHWVLQEWPKIKRSVPHATLKIFYRLQPWIDGFKSVAYFPPIERLRARANYIEDCLRRMSDPKWGITVCDSVSREQIEREMCEAEVLAYPTDTVSWSEGWSCSTLEGCAARACPVIMDCDALGEIYREAVCVADRGDVAGWRDHVIRMLTDREARTEREAAARSFAEAHTWRLYAERLMVEINKRMPAEKTDAA